MCRRCSECPNSSHHWIPESPIGDDGDDFDEGPEWGCKHCNAFGDTCPSCYGDGIDPNDYLPQISGDPNPCPDCDGEGVILKGGGDKVYSRNETEV
jgi:hypothetical protein